MIDHQHAQYAVMSRSKIRIVIWLVSFLIAVAVALLITAVGIYATDALWNMGTDASLLVWIALPLGCVAGYQAGVRADRFGRTWLSAKWPVGTAEPGEGSADFSVTDGQRRQIVLFAAIVLFVVPLVIMGNCSGFNEGSMAVTSCAVDFPLARALADLLLGILLISAFMAGLPIFTYVAACIFLLKRLNRALGKAPRAVSNPARS